MNEAEPRHARRVCPDEETSPSADIASAYLEVRSRLMRFASRYLRQTQEIEDVVQEACVRALEAQNRCTIHSPQSYLFRTTRNLALKVLDKCDYRLTDNIGEKPLETVLPGSASLEEQLEARESFASFCRAVRSLPVKCQRIFILRKVYGYSPTDIADHLGISVKTVEGHIAKGIVRCTDFMDAEEAAGEQLRSKAAGRTGKQQAQ